MIINKYNMCRNNIDVILMSDFTNKSNYFQVGNNWLERR